MTDDDHLHAVRAFVRAELLGRDAELDVRGPAPGPGAARFVEAGLGNWWLAPAHGGPGRSLAHGVRVVNELAYADAGTAFTVFIPILAATMVDWYGAPELAAKYLGAMWAGGGYAATLGSEHEAGSELARITTTATLTGDLATGTVRLDGAKAFSTDSDFADFLVVVAAAASPLPGYVAVLVPRDTPGIEVRKRWEMIGLHSSATYEVDLRGVRVPAQNILRGNGLRVLEVGLNASRILIAASAVGIARRARDLCLDYARTKTVKGAPLATNAVFAARLGQMESDIEVMSTQCLAAARAFDEVAAADDPGAQFLRTGTLKAALVAKMFCGRTGYRLVSTAAELFGGLGYTEELPIGKLVRDIRYVSIVEGGDDALRDLVYSRYTVPVGKRA